MKYSVKLLFSPAKWLCCLAYIAAIPIVMYVPTYYDFVNVSTLYFPFVGIVLFADISLLDSANSSEEIVYLSNQKPISTFLLRYFITVFLLLAYIICSNLIFRVIHLTQGGILTEPISLLEYILIVACSSLYIGSLSMLISAVFNNVYIGYGCACVFWVYWNVNYKIQFFINPFPFIANPTFYEKPTTVLYILTITLTGFTCFFSSRSPFFIQDQIQKLNNR